MTRDSAGWWVGPVFAVVIAAFFGGVFGYYWGQEKAWRLAEARAGESGLPAPAGGLSQRGGSLPRI